MKIVDKIEQWQKENPGRPFLSLEFFPPKTPEGLLTLHECFRRCATHVQPLWVDVTWRPSSSNPEITLDLCAEARGQYSLEPVMHLTCTNMTKARLHQILDECACRGIKNILALRGDEPPTPPPHLLNGGKQPPEFQYAVDLVRYIHETLNGVFCIVVAGYPEGHAENPDPEDNLRHLNEKYQSSSLCSTPTQHLWY